MLIQITDTVKGIPRSSNALCSITIFLALSHWQRKIDIVLIFLNYSERTYSRPVLRWETAIPRDLLTDPAVLGTLGSEPPRQTEGNSTENNCWNSASVTRPFTHSLCRWRSGRQHTHREASFVSPEWDEHRGLRWQETGRKCLGDFATLRAYPRWGCTLWHTQPNYVKLVFLWDTVVSLRYFYMLVRVLVHFSMCLRLRTQRVLLVYYNLLSW